MFMLQTFYFISGLNIWHLFGPVDVVAMDFSRQYVKAVGNFAALNILNHNFLMQLCKGGLS